MTDSGRRIGGGGHDDEDRLPWLEPVEDEESESGGGAGRLIGALVICLVAIGLVVGGIFWLRGDGSVEGDGQLIAAPGGDYKVPATDPGGMDVQGEGDATYAASQGVPTDAAIDISRQPEAPIAGIARAPVASPAPVQTTPLPPSNVATPAQPQPQPPQAAAVKPPEAKPVEAKPAEKVAEAKPVEPKPKPAEPKKEAEKPATKTVSIQLGAFTTEAKAKAAWSDLAGRFPSLGSLSHSVALAEVGTKKLYRLRASTGNKDKAASLCRALTSAKEPCNVVG